VSGSWGAQASRWFAGNPRVDRPAAAGRVRQAGARRVEPVACDGRVRQATAGELDGRVRQADGPESSTVAFGRPAYAPERRAR
jgi:hypothetical protein